MDMKNKLKVIVYPVNPKSLADFIEMEKEIEFTPSKGLIIYEPIYGVISTVVYDKGVFTANIDCAIKPTDEKTLEWLKTEGWVECKKNK